MNPLDETALPRYLEIRRDIQNRIASGELRPGDAIPSEHDLKALYGCSRMTVSKALSALTSEGLIQRRRRAGSQVAMPRNAQTVLKIHDLKAEIAASGRAYRCEILKREKRAPDAAEIARLGQPVTEALALELVHFADALPYAVENRLMNLAIVPDAASADFSETPPGSWLLNEVPWTDAEHIIRADIAPPALARRLAMPKGAACLVIDRRTWQGGVIVTAVTLHYPAARHQIVSHFSPGGSFGA